MTNYVKTTNFSAKDSLAAGDPNKRITGAGHDTEYDAIETASATKANLASPALTGTPTVPTAAVGTDSTQAASTAYVQTELDNFTFPFGTQNIGLATAVASNALTIDVRTKDLGDATATDQVQIVFRNSTATTGDYNVRTVSGSLDITIPDGATLGFTNSETGFIYVYAIDNSGTVEMAVTKRALFEEGATLNTTVLDTSSDSATVLYSTTARTGVPIRLIGRMKVQTGATAGEWGNAPSILSLWQIGMKRTNEIVQVLYSQTGANATGTTVMVLDDTIPQITEGIEFMTLAVTPTDSENTLLIESQGNSSHNSAATVIMALFQDATANALAAIQHSETIANFTRLIFISHSMAAGTTSSTTFRIRIGESIAGTTSFNGIGGARDLGGVMNSYIKITELQA